jgi:hypothetical protein
MKIVEDGNVRHEYVSALGADFLSMHEWAVINLTPAEMVIYENEEMTAEKAALFSRWIVDQQITSSKCYIDDVLQ